ncbi:MAG: DNA-binding protein [Clostridia bacterium]|nr:DNA-binding protein [Clostridia bacterium]
MSKDLALCDLLDVYGPLLNEKQRRLLELYYYDDLSLSEIAENEGGSRQGAADMIKRAGKELEQFEKALSLVKKGKERQGLITSLRKAINKGNNEQAQNIINILEEMG